MNTFLILFSKMNNILIIYTVIYITVQVTEGKYKDTERREESDMSKG